MRTTAGTGVHEHVKTTTFPRQIQVAPAARQFVRQAAAGHPAADDAVLLAAELIANSVVHALDATTVTITVRSAKRSSASMSATTAPSVSRTCALVIQTLRTAAGSFSSTSSPSGGLYPRTRRLVLLGRDRQPG